jgi:hypothetical protein
MIASLPASPLRPAGSPSHVELLRLWLGRDGVPSVCKEVEEEFREAEGTTVTRGRREEEGVSGMAEAAVGKGRTRREGGSCTATRRSVVVMQTLWRGR